MFRKRALLGTVAAVMLTSCGGGGMATTASHSPAPTATNQSGGSRAEGRQIEQKLQAGWDQYKFQDVSTMAKQLGSSIRGKPTATQVGAIEVAFVYAKKLVAQQRLNGDQNGFIRDIELQFPALKQTLDQELPHS